MLLCSHRKGSATKPGRQVDRTGAAVVCSAVIRSRLTRAWDIDQCSCQCHSMWQGLCQQGTEDHSLTLQVGLQVAGGTFRSARSTEATCW